MKILLSFTDILCVQEHFLLDAKDKKHSNTNYLKSTFGDSFDMFITPAYKDNGQVCRGRGKGGLAIIWKSYLSKYVTQVKSNNFRLQAAKFDLPSQSLKI